MRIGYPRILLAFILTIAVISCKSSDSDDEEASDTTDEEETLSANGLTAATATELSLSVLPQSTSTSLLLQDDDEDKKTPGQKKADRLERLSGEVSDCFASIGDDRTAETVTCYEFDNDLNPFNNGPAGSGGTADGKHTDGEACTVAFARQKILDSIQYIERAQKLVEGVFCQVKNEGGPTDPPEEGAEAVDLSEYLSGVTAVTFSAATLEHAGTDNDGNPIYLTKLAFKGKKGRQTRVQFAYSKGEESEAGTISFSSPVSQPGGQQDKPKAGGAQGGQPEAVAALQLTDNNEENMMRVVSAQFTNTFTEGARNQKVEIRKSHILKTLDPLFTAKGLVNYAIIPDAAENDTSNSHTYVSYDIDPDTYAGKLSHFNNPGGKKDENGRGLNFEMSENEDGVLTGCVVSGAANTSIRDAVASEEVDKLSAEFFWHPFGGQNTSPDKDDRYDAAADIGQSRGSSITGQCFKQNAESGLYEIDYAATKALSDTTDEGEIDDHGYDVFPSSQNDITPPGPPPAPPEGSFSPDLPPAE